MSAMSLFHQQILPVRNKLYRFALRITGSVHEAEDVVQDVLTKAWKTSEEPESAAQIRNWEAWCMTLTHNRSLDRNRFRNVRRTDSLDVIPDTVSVETTHAQHLEGQDMIDRVRQMMQQLPEKHRLVMHLRDIEEMTYDEIAQTLDMSLDQVKSNLHRARKAIREQMLQTLKSI
jgi:RNA polymerase sigma factor (sigma-70 family)